MWGTRRWKCWSNHWGGGGGGGRRRSSSCCIVERGTDHGGIFELVHVVEHVRNRLFRADVAGLEQRVQRLVARAAAHLEDLIGEALGVWIDEGYQLYSVGK